MVTMNNEEFNSYKRELRKRKNITLEEARQICTETYDIMNMLQARDIEIILNKMLGNYLDFDELLEELKKVKTGDEYIALLDRTNYDRNEIFIVCSGLIDDKYYAEVFRHVYCKETTMQNYINNKKSKHYKNAHLMLDKVQQLERERLLSLDILKERMDTDGFITIFRGLNDYNSRRLKANSWTIDEDTGNYFATKLFTDDSVGQIYQGKVHINDIITYIDCRNEFEVVVRFENVRDVKMIRELKESDYIA